MKNVEIKIIQRSTGEEVYTETTNKAADITYAINLAMVNDCYLEIQSVETSHNRKEGIKWAIENIKKQQSKNVGKI